MPSFWSMFNPWPRFKDKRIPYIVALQWTGSNFDDIYKFAPHPFGFPTDTPVPDKELNIIVGTCLGPQAMRRWDWIIIDVKGKFRVVPKETFKKTYRQNS